MSHRATLYVKELRRCPNGEAVSQREKLVLYALADYHQDKLGVNTYPSVASLAEESMMDVRSCRRMLDSAERKGVIERQASARSGRGHVTFYRFCELDKKEGHHAPVSVRPNAAHFLPERGAKEGQKRGTERTPSKEEQEQEQVQVPTPLPPAQSPQRAKTARWGPRPGRGECDRKEPPHKNGNGPLIEADVDQALERLCMEFGWEARRLRLKLRAVMVRRAKRIGESAEAVGEAMADAWRRVGKASPRLFRQPKAVEFYEQGMWLDANRWPWDNQQIREENLRAQAGAGTWRGPD